MRIQALIVVLLILLAGQALAQPAEGARERAREHYSRGLELADQGQFQQALDEFSTAYETSPHFAVLYNIGQAYIALGKPVEAVASLERYLDEAGALISVERIAQIQAQIAAQKALIAEVRIALNVQGASISIDGVAVGAAPLARPLRVTPGTHTISVKAQGRPELLHSITVFAGQTLDLALDVPAAPVLAPSPAAPVANAPPPASAGLVDSSVETKQGPGPLDFKPASSQTPTQTTVAYVLGAAGIALGGLSLGHYFWNKERFGRWQSEHNKLKTEPKGDDYRQRQLDNNELAASIDRAERVTVGLALAGGVSLAAGATLLVLRFDAGTESTSGSQAALSVGGVW